MDEIKFLEPKEVEIEDKVANVKKTYIISKIPAFQARTIMVQYVPTQLMNFNRDEQKVEEMIMKLLYYVGVKLEDGRVLRLETRDLVNNHCPSFETVIQLEAQMIDYNTSFFHDGKGLDFLKRLEVLATEKITGILTVLSDRLLQKK